MTRRALVGVGLLAMLAASGCLGGSDDGDDEGVGAPLPAGPTGATAIAALADTVLVSTPQHRIAEFMVQRDPNDPDHLVTAFGDYDSPGGVLNCAFAVSDDGGASWTVSEPVPGFSDPYLQFDGWVDFDEWGGVHAICIEQVGPEAPETEAWPYYFRSTDGGLTWGEATRIPTEEADRSTDKTVLAVGRDGTVYGGVSGLVGTTQDNGTTWRPMSEVEQGFAVLNGFVEDNAGTIFLSGSGDGAEVWVERTSDRGLTWTHAVAGESFVPPGFNDQNRWVEQRPWTALPTLSHDPLTDEIWVAYQTWDTEYNGYRLHLMRSTDHGVTFEPTTIPEFPSAACTDPCHVTHPAVGFDLAGNVGLIVQLTQDGGHLKEVYFTASPDRGATWLAPFGLSNTNGMGPDSQSWSNPNAFAPLPENAGNIGDDVEPSPGGVKGTAAGLALTTAVSELQLRWNGEYWGLTASSQGFVAMWIDHTNDGRPQLYSRLLAVS